MARLRALPVSITRFVDKRVIVDREQIGELFSLFIEMFEKNLEGTPEPDRGFLRRHGEPTIKMRLTDGSTYQGNSSDLLDEVDTDPKRLIKSLEMKVGHGELSASLEIDTASRLSGPVILHVAGPEDSARRVAESIERILLRRRDVTTFVERLWPLFLGFVVVLLILGQSISRFLIGEAEKGATAFAGSLLGLVGLVAFLATVASIPFEVIKRRWLKKAAFLWGEDLARYHVANRICQAIAFGIPTWLLGNVASVLLF